MVVMEAWQQHYQRAVYIDLHPTDQSPVEDRARKEATRRGWTFERLSGDHRLFRKLLHGDWDDDMLAVEPGQQIRMTHDDAVIGCLNVREMPQSAREPDDRVEIAARTENTGSR
jgi:hypothetical protein